MEKGKVNSQFQILAIGEILWDLFPDRSCFGGVPANFACATAELGSNQVAVQMFSGVGKDDLGDRALSELAKHGVDCQSIQRLEQPTDTVDIELNDDGSARYEFAAECRLGQSGLG